MKCVNCLHSSVFLHIFLKISNNDTEKMIKTDQKKTIANSYCIVLFDSDKFKMFVKVDNI